MLTPALTLLAVLPGECLKHLLILQPIGIRCHLHTEESLGTRAL